MKTYVAILLTSALLSAGSPVGAQQSGPRPTMTISAGISAITDHRGNPGIPISLGLSGKTPTSEWTVIAGRLILLPGVGGGFGVETGFNISPKHNGVYGGMVVSRIGTGDDAILSVGLRAGTRPVEGRGRRMEVRVEVADDEGGEAGGWSVFMAYVSIGYDFGRKAQK